MGSEPEIFNTSESMLMFTDMVRLSDYEALEAKLREARGLVEEWRNDHRDYPESKQDCADELAAILGGDHEN